MASASYALIGADGVPFRSASPGRFGGHRRQRVYGRLDCPAAQRAIEAGGYVTHRVFFADEAAAISAGYRPCARCLPAEYRAWKDGAGIQTPERESRRRKVSPDPRLDVSPDAGT